MAELIRVRVVTPPELVDRVRSILDDPGVAHLTQFPQASLLPPGDVIEADVVREAAGELIDRLGECGLDGRGGVTIGQVDSVVSSEQERADVAAEGEPDDAVVWPLVVDQAEAETRGSFSYHVFLTIGCALAAIAVLTDSAVLVVGAMVVSPDFAAVSAISVGLMMRRPRISLGGLRLLGWSFLIAIVGVTALALIGRLAGVVTVEHFSAPRPMTGFIWHPDLWSFVVALLAGAAGTLSMTSGKATAMVGVFISVTTVPAAGNLALALALWQPAEMLGSVVQLVVNIVGMVIAGVLTLLVLRLSWDRVLSERSRQRVIARHRRSHQRE